MNGPLTAEDMGVGIIEALGLGGQHVRSLVLTVTAGQIPTVRVTREVWDDSGVDGGALRSVLETYELKTRVP